MTETRNVLLVDDDNRVLFVLKGALARVLNGYDLLAFQDPRQALQTLQRANEEDGHEIVLLITDLRMQDVDGVALTEGFRQRYPEAPVIWITGHGCQRASEDAKRLEIDCCLDKPIEIQEIRRVVRDALADVNGA